LGGELILIDPARPQLQIVSRLPVFQDTHSKRAQILSFPAIVGERLYLRGENELLCVELPTKG